jgi:5-histidylcysteine sulfoxide synthase
MIEVKKGKKSENDCHDPVSLKEANREILKGYFENTWWMYENLFSSIQLDSSYYLSPDPLRNPIIFYYGHTAVFYVNKLLLSGLIETGINSRFEEIFAKGVDPELPEHLKTEYSWPSVATVKEYRDKVYDLVNSTIATTELPAQITSDHPLWALHMAMEHDRIHFETSSVLIRQMNAELVSRPKGWEYAPTFGYSEEFELIQVPGGEVTLGKEEPCYLFGWDNEFGHLKADVKSFAVTKNLITNGEFLNFVKMGEYNNHRYWSEEALKWKSRTNTELPKFWVKEGETYRYRAMFDIIDMPLDWPVEVNAFEAHAYCRFKGSEFRLLKEAEFKLLTSRLYPDAEPAISEGFNNKMCFCSPSPVGYFDGVGGNVFNDLYGNVWGLVVRQFLFPTRLQNSQILR